MMLANFFENGVDNPLGTNRTARSIRARSWCITTICLRELSNAQDTRGIKRVGCSSESIPPVPLTVTWTITTPSGTLTGVGNDAPVEVTELGTFTASADRECLQDQQTVGPESATTPSNYRVFQLKYRTFIHCNYIQAGYPSPAYPFYSGDGRVFGQDGTSRTSQTISVTVDPRDPTGLVGSPMQGADISNGYITLNENPPPPNPVWCDFLCRFTAGPGQQPNCSGVSLGGWEIVGPERVSVDEVSVRFRVFAVAGCSTPLITPSIDVDMTVFVRQPCSNGVLGHRFLRFAGTADRFPWHELLVDEFVYKLIDPCFLLTDGFALLGPMVPIQLQWVDLDAPP